MLPLVASVILINYNAEPLINRLAFVFTPFAEHYGEINAAPVRRKYRDGSAC
jgi:hypothetical protein